MAKIKILLVLAGLVITALVAGELNVGQQAPDFWANDDSGNLFQLSDYLGKQVIVLYFYPAAMTFGCTNQACHYRDSRDELVDLGVKVIGVSGDAVRSLAVFKKENLLNFTLVSDINGEIAEKYGVPVGKGGSVKHEVEGSKEELYRSLTTSRWTFIIDKGGKVIYKDTSVNPMKDTERVLEFLRTRK